MKITYYIVYIFIICVPSSLFSQIPSTPQKVVKRGLDSIPEFNQTNNNPSLIDTTINPSDSLSFDISEDALDEEFEYGAVDSQHIDIIANRMFLYGDAFVKYKDMEIKAGFIEFDLNNNEAIASTKTDVLGREIGKPTFLQGEQNISYEKLRFNFKTQKGLVYNARSKQGNLFVHGAITKFISQESDSLLFNDEIYNKSALVTSCDHEHPHYGIRTTKLKIVPDKLAIMGPANLEIAGIPTPLFLPFAFLPIMGGGGQTNGLIFPQNYEFDRELGFGFREVGYYYRMNEYLEFRLTGDIYTRGSWGLRLGTNYAKRYKYRGNVQLGFSKRITETEGFLDPNINRSISLRVTHNQDSKAHPFRNLGGSINITTMNYDRQNFSDVASQINNVLSSSLNFTHKMPSTPFNFSAGFQHSQNTRTGDISFTLPDIQLRMNQIQPFKRKVQSGGEKWFERINLRYTGKFKSFVSTKDSLIFDNQTLEDWQLGFSHDVQTSTSFSLLKYFNVNPSVTYDELWYFKENERIADTTSALGYEEVLNPSFNTFRDLDASVNMTTNIFGTVQFKKGWLRGLRHVIKPSIGFTYSPNTDRYLENYIDPNDPDADVDLYNPFPRGIFGTPSLNQKQMALTYGFTNIIEGKYYSKRDSTEKKFKVFNNISVNGSRNFALDSLQWSRVRVSGTARFFGGITNVNVRATFDPYKEENNIRINEAVSADRWWMPIRFEDFTTRITSRFTFKQIGELFRKKDENKEEKRGGLNRQQSNRSQPGDEKIFSMVESFSINHSIDFRYNQSDGENDFNITNHTIRISGSSIPITRKWSISGINMSYDLSRKTWGYPSLQVSRQLHCWNMKFNWAPVYGSYSFFIGVTASDLGQFLKYNYGENLFNNRRF